MKYGTPKCPECGETTMGHCDLTPGCAEVDEQEGGTFEYAGGTEMFWDGQVNVNEMEMAMLKPFVNDSPKIAERYAFLDAHIHLQCHNGHEWDSTFSAEDA